jgi:penicillin-insensitive murein endopeptidase
LSAFAAEYGPTIEGDFVAAENSGPPDTGVVGCADQSLQDGVQLPDLPLFFTRSQPDHAWGTQEMVELLVDTARHMRWLMPDASPITMGEISRQRGGELSGHKTHRGGIDADVGIYLSGQRQAPGIFLNPGPGQFDVEANWALISAMLDTGRIDMLLLDRAHIARLKAYVLSAGLLSKEEASQVFVGEGRGSYQSTGVLRHAPNHQDHLHVRVLCPDGSRATAR